MDCPNCGADVDPGAALCGGCGFDVHSSAADEVRKLREDGRLEAGRLHAREDDTAPADDRSGD